MVFLFVSQESGPGVLFFLFCLVLRKMRKSWVIRFVWFGKLREMEENGTKSFWLEFFFRENIINVFFNVIK
jgi:hypothetical protein